MNEIKRYAQAVSQLNSFSRSSTCIIDTIVNPVAGSFRRRRTLQKIVDELEQRLHLLRAKYAKKKIEINNIHITQYGGHERKIVDDIIESESRQRNNVERLIVAAGGDGMSNHICSSLLHADQKVLNSIKLLRFPLGTGNDCSDAKTYEDAYDLILGTQKTVEIDALEIVTGQTLLTPPLYTFNVASIGLDAYITYLTNLFRRIIPGRTYKVLVNVGTLFYRHTFKPDAFDIAIWNRNRMISRIQKKITMFVAGVSGMRTYGGRIPVLPGQDNVCVVDEMSVRGQLKSKRSFYEGKHEQLPEVSFYSADNIVVDYHGNRIPLQVDGEDYVFQNKQFPLSMKSIRTGIRVIARSI